MRSRVLRTGLTLLLSAAVFLGSVIPPAVQHAHAGGDQPHNHAATPAKLPHSHPHQHPHRHSPPHQSEDKNESEGFPARHLHLPLFGWNLHLPADNSPNLPTPGSESPGDPSELLVRLIDTEVNLVSLTTIDWLRVRFTPVVGFPAVETQGENSQAGRETLASLPLCDSARGERSGVQLI